MPPTTTVRNIAVFLDETIETTVTGETIEVDRFLKGFYSRVMSNSNSVIGLSTECTMTPNHTNSRLALLQLCDENQCLIVQLSNFMSLPLSLFNFLGSSEVIFAGIGIQKSVEMLNSVYGVYVRNAVDLAKLSTFKWGDLGWFRITTGPMPADDEKTSSVIFDDWGAKHLSDEQIISATHNSYRLYVIGCRLI